ncbi:MAG: sensor domain-containing diguanylate cyclase [Helicobacteraceae bacterium]|jgi:diguanylate cyclase (GGDEF)-like protein|nr:sensor domain-containing diguanylate cyclase [Helicobacteraceae bacterium]
MFKIVFLTLFLTMFLYAVVFQLQPHMENVKTSASVNFFEDTTKKMGIDNIKAQNFKTGRAIRSKQGRSRSAWWMKLQVQNPTDEPIDWILKFNYGQFDELQSWQFNDKGLLVSHSVKGDHHLDVSKIPFAQRSSFEFKTLPEEEDTLYLKLSYVDSGIIEMFHSVWTKDAFIKSQQLRNNLLVGIISALFALLLYNIFIWIILRKNEYFWYNIYLVGVMLSLLTFNQVGSYYLWNNSLYLIDMMPFLSIGTLFVSFILFTREFLETSKFLPVVDKILKALIVVTISAVVLANFGERHLAIGLVQLVSFVFIFFPVIGFILWHRGYQIARGYTLASLLLSFTFLLSLLRYIDVLQSNELLFWVNRFGFIAEGILLSIALADRITILEKETMRAQESVRHTLEEAKNTLESEVKKRTVELEILTKKAEELARTDELTGIWNRRALLERGDDLIRFAIRYKMPFSIVIIDIDHFKDVNDKYGHEAGDITLRSFAKEISDNIRDTDFFARIGGEEFVILLAHTRADEAMEKTKILLKKIEALEISYKDLIVKVTASMGVCEFSDLEDTSYSLIAKADQALYHVKQNGRNSVHLYLEC